MSKSARPVSRQGGEIEFPKKGNVMRLLGEVYEDIRDALGEFISNAEDAEASAVRMHLLGRSRIVVEDNGTGMTREELRTVPTRVGDSIRALQEGKIGEKGIGILGFQAFADRCSIISRARGSKGTWKLSLVAGDPRFRVSSVAHGLPRSGTQVVIAGIRTGRTRVFAKKSLIAWLQTKYRSSLQERRFRLEVLDGSERVILRPAGYGGVPVKLSPVRTRYGPVKVNLFVSPMATSFRVGIVHRGRRVIRDATDLPELDHEPWRSGKVQGEIACDFCKQTTGRAGFVRDDKRYEAWVEAVRRIEGPVSKALSRAQEDERAETDRAVFKRLQHALTGALREFEEIESILAGVQRRALSGGLRKTSGGGGPGPSRPGPAGKLLRKLPPRGFTWEIEDFDEASSHLHSMYDRGLSVIRINRLHPDYERESGDAETRERYIVKLTTKELALALYPGVSRTDQAEKMIQLELCLNRNLR